MEGSPINYPVVKGHPGDPAYYLVHNFSRELSFHGAVSLDGDNFGMLTDRMTLLGAHHMKDASMFFAVSTLFNPDYYETHRGFDLLLDDGMHHANFFVTFCGLVRIQGGNCGIISNNRKEQGHEQRNEQAD